MNGYKIFETKRLLLQPTQVEDGGFIFELFNTPKWIKYIGDRNIRSADDAERYIANKMDSQLRRLGFSNYTVIRKADNVKIGICGLFDRDGIEGIDIGFALLPQYESFGYAFESANKIIEAAFEVFKLTEISAITTKDNISSQKLLQRLGLVFDINVKLPGDDEELLLYKLKGNEFRNQKGKLLPQ